MKKLSRNQIWLSVLIACFAAPLFAQDAKLPGAAPTPQIIPTPQTIPTPKITPTPSTPPTPSATSTPLPRKTPAPRPAPKPTPKATPRPKPKPTPRPTPKPTPKPTPRPQPTSTPAPLPTPTPTPQPTPLATPAPRPTPKPTALPPKPAATPSVDGIEELPLDDPLPPQVVVPKTAPAAKDIADFKPETAPAAVEGTPAAAGLPPVVRPTPLPGQTPAPAPVGSTPAAPSTMNPSGAQAENAPATSNEVETDFASVWNQNFMREALLAGVLVALICGYLGVYVVLKRIVFIGVALSEFSSAGIALAIFMGISPLLGALGFMLFGVVLFALRLSPRRVPNESFIGIIYVVAGALAILLIAKSHAGETHMLQLLQGDVILIDPAETRQMLVAFGFIGVLHLLFIKPFVLTSFDRDAASTLGFASQGWDFLLFLTIGLAIAFSIRACGTLLTTTMLILPAATSLLLVNRLKWAFVVAPLIAVLPVFIGLHISYVASVPASAVIVALAFLLMLPALAFNALSKR